MHRDVPRLRVVLQLVEHRASRPCPAASMSSDDRVGLVLVREREPGVAARARRAPLKPCSRAISSRIRAKSASSSTIRTTRSPRLIVRGRRRPRRCSERASASRSTVAVPRGRSSAVGGATAACAAVDSATRRRVEHRCCRRRRAGRKSVNVLPAPACSSTRISPPSSARDLAADREAETRAAVLAARRAVGLLERLEDQLQLVLRDADAGVARPRTRSRPRRSSSVLAREPRALCAPCDRQRHAALLGELERVREQVLEHLLQALLVGVDRRAARPAATSTSKSSPFCSATGRNVRSTKSAIASSETSVGFTSILPASTFDRSRMSLISSSRSVPACRSCCANSTCFVGQVRLRVVGEQLREDEQRVERRAQLVAHVREELALVLRAERELLRLLLEREPRRLDLRGSSARPARSARRAAPPSPRAPRSSAAAPPAAAWSSSSEALQRLRLRLELLVRPLELVAAGPAAPRTASAAPASASATAGAAPPSACSRRSC